jgi:predicted transcriptional regulator
MAIRRPMGALEADVLACLWTHADGLTAAEAQEALGLDLAYTTVATILVRLHDKGLADRHAAGRGFRYTARVSPEEVIARRMHRALEGATNRKEALAHFVEDLTARDAKALRAILDRPERRR